MLIVTRKCWNDFWNDEFSNISERFYGTVVTQTVCKATIHAPFHRNDIKERTTVGRPFRSTPYLGGYGGIFSTNESSFSRTLEAGQAAIAGALNAARTGFDRIWTKGEMTLIAHEVPGILSDSRARISK